MHIIINTNSMVPIYEQIVDAIAKEIMDGALSAGSNLPSVRALANTLRISSLTVKKAYDVLENRGLITTIHGKGSFVSMHNDGLIKESLEHDAEEKINDGLNRLVKLGYTKQQCDQLLHLLLEDLYDSN